MTEEKKTRSNENGISPLAGEDDTFYTVDQNAAYKDDDIRRLRVTDPANADTVFNPLFRRILNNIRALFRDKFNRSEFTKENILGKLTGGSGGGAGTGLDADTVDGKHASAFASTAVATQSANGLFSAADKRKLDGVQAGAKNYTHPATHPVSMITGLGNAAKLNTGTTAGTVAAGNHSHGTATQTAAGFMSVADKKKVDTIPAKHVGKDVSSGTGGVGCEIFGCYAADAANSANPSTIGAGSKYCGAMGFNNKINGKTKGAFAIGEGNVFLTDSDGDGANNSIVLGLNNVIGDGINYILGWGNQISSIQSCAIGLMNELVTGYALGLGNESTSGNDCYLIGADNTTYDGYSNYGFALGQNLIVDDRTLAVGYYNAAKQGNGGLYGTDGDRFTIGSGVDHNKRSNCFRVQGDGKTYAKGSYSSSGADFAEYKEWLDGNPDNEDRRGYFVTFDGAMIRKATSKDNFILGVISANPVLIGNDPGDEWNGRFEKDIFGSYIYKEYEQKEAKTRNSDGIRPKVKDPKDDPNLKSTWYVENLKYRSSEPYLTRDERSEWGIVGCLGELVVVDDGTCEPNGYCLPNDEGIGTKSDDPRGYRVMKRLDETHILVWIHGRILL